MKKLFRRRPSPAMVIATMALLVALGGTGYAATSLPIASVGTAQLKANAVVSSKVRNGSLLRVDFAAGQVPRGPAGAAGPAGPAGPSGPAGPAGPAGASATALWASVNSSGSFARSVGTTSAGRLDVGQYEIVFNKDVSGCGYVGTLGNATTDKPGSGEISVAPRKGNANAVFVATFTDAGVAADKSFFLSVFC